MAAPATYLTHAISLIMTIGKAMKAASKIHVIPLKVPCNFRYLETDAGAEVLLYVNVPFL